jgi:hypothetical protein
MTRLDRVHAFGVGVTCDITRGIIDTILVGKVNQLRSTAEGPVEIEIVRRGRQRLGAPGGEDAGSRTLTGRDATRGSPVL